MDVGLLLIHALVGATVAAHGAQKLFGWFGGFGLDGTACYMESVGLRPGKLMAAAAGAAEVAGGSLLALGLVTPFGALLVASTMLVAIFTDSAGKGFWIYKGGFEYELVIAAVAVGFAFNGAGAWSLDNAIGWDIAGAGWGVGVLVLSVLGAAGTLVLGRRGLPASASPSAV